MIKFNIIL